MICLPPTQEQIDRFFPILHDTTKFQEVCSDAIEAYNEEVSKHADVALPFFKVRRTHAKTGDTQAVIDAINHNPTPSILFIDGRMFALARNGAIGEGSFGRVKLIVEINKDLQTGQFSPGDVYAMKIEKTNTPDQIREHAITQQVKNAVGKKQERAVDKTDAEGKKYDHKYYSQQIFLGSSLASHVKTLPTNSPERILIAIQLCERIAELHEVHHIAHHDIKLANATILDGVVHLIDFGLAEALTTKVNLRGTPIQMLGAESTPDVSLENPEKLSERLRKSISKHGNILNPEEKDKLALIRTLYLPTRINTLFPRNLSLLTPQLVNAFPKKLQTLINTETVDACIERKNDKPMMIAVQLVLQQHLADEDIHLRNALIDFVMIADKITLNGILAIHHDKTLSPDGRSGQLKEYFSILVFKELDELQSQVQRLNDAHRSALDVTLQEIKQPGLSLTETYEKICAAKAQIKHVTEDEFHETLHAVNMIIETIDDKLASTNSKSKTRLNHHIKVSNVVDSNQPMIEKKETLDAFLKEFTAELTELEQTMQAFSAVSQNILLVLGSIEKSRFPTDHPCDLGMDEYIKSIENQAELIFNSFSTLEVKISELTELHTHLMQVSQKLNTPELEALKSLIITSGGMSSTTKEEAHSIEINLKAVPVEERPRYIGDALENLRQIVDQEKQTSMAGFREIKKTYTEACKDEPDHMVTPKSSHTRH